MIGEDGWVPEWTIARVREGLVTLNLDEDLVERLMAHFEKVQAQPGALPLTPEACIEMLIKSAINEVASGD